MCGILRALIVYPVKIRNIKYNYGKLIVNHFKLHGCNGIIYVRYVCMHLHVHTVRAFVHMVNRYRNTCCVVVVSANGRI